MATILVIDDDGGVRGAIRKILEADGHEILEAADGAEGLRVYSEVKPDLVLTDLYMPGVDGFEAVIRVMGEFPDARVMVMSGGGWESTAAVLEQARQLGAAAVLSKPFDVDELRRIVTGVLSADE